MPIARDAIPEVALPEELVHVEPLGGEVIVRGMDLPQMLRFNGARRRLVEPQEGESADEAAERAGGALSPLVLSMCVLADDRQPVYSEAQWAVWYVRHIDAAHRLLEVALRLSGQEAAEKKA